MPNTGVGEDGQLMAVYIPNSCTPAPLRRRGFGPGGDLGQHRRAVALELRRPDAGYGAELRLAAGRTAAIAASVESWKTT